MEENVNSLVDDESEKAKRE